MRFGMALGWLLIATGACGQVLPLPPRPADAFPGSVVGKAVTDLPLAEREARLEAEILRGNVPDFLRRFCAVAVTNVIAGKTNSATFFAAPDYLAVGSDEDYFLTPLRPETAQRIADALGCSLPTRAMVDAIYAAAEVKLEPHPMPPGATMTTVPVFVEHNSIVRKQSHLHAGEAVRRRLVSRRVASGECREWPRHLLAQGEPCAKNLPHRAGGTKRFHRGDVVGHTAAWPWLRILRPPCLRALG